VTRDGSEQEGRQKNCVRHRSIGQLAQANSCEIDTKVCGKHTYLCDLDQLFLSQVAADDGHDSQVSMP
jgi:hypothetical protein